VNNHAYLVFCCHLPCISQSFFSGGKLLCCSFSACWNYRSFIFSLGTTCWCLIISAIVNYIYQSI
jgi:hypothetical protein